MVNSKSDTDYKKSFWRSKLFEFCNEVLTENRKKAHLTQKKVASVLDLDQSEVSRIERGITKPNDIITIESICDIYKLTPNQKREYLQLTCGITESINNDALLGLVDNQINFIANLNLSGYASLAIKQSQNLRAWLENNIDFTNTKNHIFQDKISLLLLEESAAWRDIDISGKVLEQTGSF